MVLATLEPPPDWLGVTYWSSRWLADHLGDTSNVSGRADLARVESAAVAPRDVQVLHRPPGWRRGLTTSLACTWTRRKAVVLSIDEESQIQALDRTAGFRRRSVRPRHRPGNPSYRPPIRDPARRDHRPRRPRPFIGFPVRILEPVPALNRREDPARATVPPPPRTRRTMHPHQRRRLAAGPSFPARFPPGRREAVGNCRYRSPAEISAQSLWSRVNP